MMIWVDAQMSPEIASWMSAIFSAQVIAIRDLGLRDADDKEIFQAAKKANAVVMTKDNDFILLLEQLGAPPQILWITCGNTSNAHLKTILMKTLPKALELLQAGEALVEINAA